MASLTLIVVRAGVLTRADLSGDPPRVTALHNHSRPPQGTLADLVEAAARSGGPVRGPVWVLTDDAFVQVVKLNPLAVAGLKDEEVGKALAYEAQVVSGMTAEDSALAWRGYRTEGREREFQVVQMPAAERDRVAAAVNRLGGRLAGIVHPAALPAPLAAGANGSGWGRLEVWRGLYALVENPDGQGLRAHIHPNVGPRALRAIPGSDAATECLVAAPEGEPADLDGLPVFRLEEEGPLRQWLEGWGEVLRKPGNVVAAIVPVAKPMTRGAAVAVGAVALLAAGLLMLWDARGIKSREDGLAKQVAEARAPSVTLGKLKAAVETQRRELNALSAEVPAGALPAPGYLKRVLDAIAERRPAGVMVVGLEIAWDEATVRGFAADSGSADVLATALGEALRPDGVRVVPGRKQLQTGGERAGLYQFDLTIVPSEAPSK